MKSDILRFASLWLAVILAAAAPSLPAHADETCNEPEPVVYVSLKHAMEQARQLMSQDRYEEALERLRSFDRKNPRQRHWRLYSLMGILAAQLKENPQAASWFEKAIRMWPCDGQTLRNLAVARHKDGKTEEAARLMERAYGLIRPADPDVLYQAACLWMEAGMTAQALPLLDALCREPSPRTEWLLLLLQVHIQDRNLAKAASLLHELRDRMPGREDLWRTDAWIALEQGDYVRAAASLEIAFLLKPPDRSGREQLAQIYVAAGVPLMAARQYRLAFGETPDAGQLDTLARAYLLAHDDAAAVDAAHEAVRKQPTADRWAALGNIYLTQQNYPEALAAFSRAAGLEDTGGRMSLTAGYVAAKMEDWDVAVTFLKKAIAGSANDPRTHKEASQSLSSIQDYLRESP